MLKITEFLCWLVGWLVSWFNAELPPSWRGPKSQEVGKERTTIPNTTLSPPERLLHSDRQRWEPCNVALTVKGESHTAVSTDHNV